MRKLLIVGVMTALLVGVVGIDAFAQEEGAEVTDCSNESTPVCHSVDTPSGNRVEGWSAPEYAGAGVDRASVDRSQVYDPINGTEGPYRGIRTPSGRLVVVQNQHEQDTPSYYGQPK